MALFDSKASKHGFIVVWVLGGIARQIGFDTKSGVLSAKNLFASWMKSKWQRLPKPVRKVAFGIGVSARAAYRGARHTGRTIKHGARIGAIEGAHRHRESMELQALHREMPGGREHPHYAEALERIKEARQARWTEHQVHATDIRLAARQKQAPPSPPKPIPPVVEDPPQPTATDPVVATSKPKVDSAGIPHHPGEPAAKGDWTVVYVDVNGKRHVEDNLTQEYARDLWRWQEWRKDAPGGYGGVASVGIMADRLDRYRTPESNGLADTNGHVNNPDGCPSCAHNH